MISIVQFSDTHFSRPGHRSHGGFGYDTDAAWAETVGDAFGPGRDLPDLTVVTGDLVDRGQADEYRVAVERLVDVPTPVTLQPGNHDFEAPFLAAMARPGVSIDRAVRLGPWLFVFADSNGDGRAPAPDQGGRIVDRPNRIEAKGLLGSNEIAWLDEVITASDADHVWLWMHHPPAMIGAFARPDFDAEIVDLIGRHPRVRGIGAGHVHTDVRAEIANRPVYVCPALTINFDMEQWITLPPGYRRYRFGDDGSVESETHLLAHDDRWPRFDLPEPVIAHFRGELGFDEMLARMAN